MKPPETQYGKIALEFAKALAAEDFALAYSFLHQEDVDLEEELGEMLECYDGPITLIEECEPSGDTHYLWKLLSALAYKRCCFYLRMLRFPCSLWFCEAKAVARKLWPEEIRLFMTWKTVTRIFCGLAS